MAPPPPELLERLHGRGPYVALRWVLHPVLGIPLEPFTVWRRPVQEREPATAIAGFAQAEGGYFRWDGVTEMLRIELDVTGGPGVALGLGARESGGAVASATAPGGAATLVLEGGPMTGVQVLGAVNVTAARGLSAVTMANGGGWQPIEVVGLPLLPATMAGIYYQPGSQGPVGALTDPRQAALQRLEQWGPAMGWMTLVGLPPWRPPDAARLLDDLDADLLPALRTVLTNRPPPAVDLQQLEVIETPLASLRQAWSAFRPLNGGAPNEVSRARVRPLTALSTAVASDPWMSLALGFGTGAAVGERDRGVDDFMVTAPWKGQLRQQLEMSWPWPWLPRPDPIEVRVDVERELAAVVLSPKARPWPAAPAPVSAGVAFPDGAPSLDAAYRSTISISTPRRAVMPQRPRTAAYALARFDGPASGRYAMRERPGAGGWVPVSAALPVPPPQTKPDPAVPKGAVMLRDGGVPHPVSGPPASYQYALAAGDLFGQWGPWSTVWLSLPAAGIRAPAIGAVQVRAAPGAGNADPCQLRVTADVTWEWRERRCSRLELRIDVYDPPPPPALIPPPHGAPQATLTRATAFIGFDLDGVPTSLTPGVTVVPVSDDGETVLAAAQLSGLDLRHLRVTFAAVDVTFGPAREKAVALFARGEERLRPGEWGSWSNAQEAAIAPNPIPPPTPPPLPAVYPRWASLPDPAGFSRAAVEWNPLGARAFRIYEATEAALLAACGRPGPVLTRGYAARMEDLFELYRNPANLPKLRAAYRKVGEEPVSPPLQPDGMMRHQVLLPRGSALIHCFVVVAVTDANVVSAWPQPDANGRQGFIPYAIPSRRQPVVPQIVAALDATGIPRVTVRVGGAVPATGIRLYRAPNARLAREIGTMDLIASVATDPGAWEETAIADPGAVRSWSFVQYRAVALAADDLDGAGMAVPSPASKAYALLFPPAEPPAVALAANVTGTTQTRALVRLTTDAPRATTDVGDHTLSIVVERAGGTAERFSAPLVRLPLFPTAAALAASSEWAGYVGSAPSAQLHLRLERNVDEALTVRVDLADPIGRARRVMLTVPASAPDPLPQIGNLTLQRQFGVVLATWVANTPQPPDPGRPWRLAVTLRRAGFLGGPAQTRTFDVPDVPLIASLADMPVPEESPQPFAIAQIDGTAPRQFAFWSRAIVPMEVRILLTNADGQTTSASGVSP
ncbi:MAG TPA: hypothetical protein VHS99_18680 [Chloroflexota bacterium]|nr:hypothetical protein [Chloroflexota bacterium]